MAERWALSDTIPKSTPLARREPALASLPVTIGTNIRRLRRVQGHSLETLAVRSGVSRAMLGQIETAKSVPTVTVICKIASALGVSVSTLIEERDQTKSFVILDDRSAALGWSGAGFTLRRLTSPEIGLAAEFSELRFEPGHREPALDHQAGRRASLYVAAGSLVIDWQDAESTRLSEGQCVLYPAERAQSYFNDGDARAIVFLVVAAACNGSD